MGCILHKIMLNYDSHHFVNDFAKDMMLSFTSQHQPLPLLRYILAAEAVKVDDNIISLAKSLTKWCGILV